MWCVLCSEIQPLETRAAACSFNVAVNMLFTFVIGQCFVTMLCSMQWGVFLFFAGESLPGVSVSCASALLSHTALLWLMQYTLCILNVVF